MVQRTDGGALMDAANVRPLCSGCHRDRDRGRWTAEDHALRGGDFSGAVSHPDPEQRASADERAVRAREADVVEVAAVEHARDRWMQFMRDL